MLFLFKFIDNRISMQADVLVVGSGNAALCAAIAALEKGAKVVMIEKANEAEMGGNSRYTAGAMRFVYKH